MESVCHGEGDLMLRRPPCPLPPGSTPLSQASPSAGRGAEGWCPSQVRSLGLREGNGSCECRPSKFQKSFLPRKVWHSRPVTSGGERCVPTGDVTGVRGIPGRLIPFGEHRRVCGAPPLWLQAGKKGHIRVPV